MIQIPENIKLIREAAKKQSIRQSTGVLHLGAHLGQEAAYYRDLNKPVVWVEALPDIYARFGENISKYDNQKALCALLGNSDGKEYTFHISNNQQGVSSSLFEFGDYASGDKSLWPDLNLIMGQKITLTPVKLDSLLLANNVDVRNYSFWVVDLQGAEKMAFEGAPMSLRSCEALYVEVSTVEVYKGGVLYTELKSYLKEMGFSPLWEPIAEHDDILFVRSESSGIPVVGWR